MVIVWLYSRLVLGLLFLVSGLSKLRNPRAFKLAVGGFRILPERLIPSTAVAVTGVEVGGSALLFSTDEAWLGAVGLALLLLAFNTGLVVNLLRGRRRLDCRCFGQPTARIGWGHVVQNTMLFGVALTVGGLARSQAIPGAGPGLLATSLTACAAVETVACFLVVQEVVGTREALRRALNRGIERE